MQWALMLQHFIMILRKPGLGVYLVVNVIENVIDSGSSKYGKEVYKLTLKNCVSRLASFSEVLLYYSNYSN